MAVRGVLPGGDRGAVTAPNLPLRDAQVTNVVYVVVRTYSWDKDNYIAVYLERAPAEAHRDLLNGEPYDIDECLDHRVWTLPLRTEPPWMRDEAELMVDAKEREA